MHLKVILLLVMFLVYHANSTLGPNDRKSKKSSKEPTKPVKSKPALETVSKEIQGIATVFERQLIKPNIINTKEIIENHATYCKDCRHLKNFQNKILGYVTPWNSKGYDLAKVFAKKMNMISPVWLQIQRKGRKKYELKGTHDIDQDWMKTVKENSQTEAGDHAEFLPRILFENLQPEDLHALFNNEEEAIALGRYLVKKANDYQFDGYTLEIYMQLGGYAKSAIHHLVFDLVDQLHANDKKLALVIPPSLQIFPNDLEKEIVSEIFNKEDFDLLKDQVDYFSLMTYDYSSSIKSVASNAPHFWVKRCVEYLTDDEEYRAKILMGLNFYGYRYEIDTKTKQLLKQPEAVNGGQFIDMLSQSENWKISQDGDWKISQEHSFYQQTESSYIVVYYPTLYSIITKIKLASELGTGLSIWELGQGLDYFFELL